MTSLAVYDKYKLDIPELGSPLEMLPLAIKKVSNRWSVKIMSNRKLIDLCYTIKKEF